MKAFHSLIAASVLCSLPVAAKSNLEFKDVFDFRYAQGQQLSENGQFLTFSAKPYRGNSEGLVYDLTTNKIIARVPQGTKPQINKAANWVAFTQVPTLLEKETTKKKDKKKLKNHLILINTNTDKQTTFAEVVDYQISDDGNWLAYRTKEKPEDDKTDKKADKPENEIKADKKDKFYSLVIVNLRDMSKTTIEHVGKFALSPKEYGVLFNVHAKHGAKNHIGFFDLNTQTQSSLFDEPGVTLSQAVWHPKKPIVAFNMANYVNDDTRRRDHQITLWHSDTNTLKEINNPTGWFTGKTAKLTWSEQGERLYFQNRPELEAKAKELKYKDEASLTDFDTIRAQKGLQVWHNNDAEIKTREAKTWQQANKNRHYQAVYHLNGEQVVQLANEQAPNIRLNTEANFLLASNDKPHLERIMYEGFFNDYAAINVKTGDQTKIIEGSPFRPSLSPTGSHAAFFKDQQVWLKDLSSQSLSPLTKAIKEAIFADDKHDYPSEQPGYGFAGWQLDGSIVYVYSKFDIWAFDVNTQHATRLTKGRETNTQYRVKYLDQNQLGFATNDTLMLHTHNTENKQSGVATLDLATGKVKTVLKGEARYALVAKAKHADKLIFTTESYHQFPDFWQTTSTFAKTKKVTDLNPQVKNFAWGGKPELVQYKGYNGEDLQGVLIKPAGYKEGDKVPTVIYFYRYMSQRMYNFPKMELNHRPNFPMFTSNGYALFLPDIRFEIGKPGSSSTQTMINAAQKLIDMGVAHPDKIGLQGHSWAGYQSAFMITQTDIFKAVVSGAPVSNMTSAYSGIRLKSGLARQFQYETGQSRIGKPLTQALDLYIENSPVFFADKVNTPVLIMFGDDDGAVPWQEGIQYYLALRRHNKDAIFLQYEGEPHHLKKFPNQVDFSIRMMEYFDHHLKGKPAADWIKDGVKHQPE